jgi:hypothetical protein
MQGRVPRKAVVILLSSWNHIQAFPVGVGGKLFHYDLACKDEHILFMASLVHEPATDVNSWQELFTDRAYSVEYPPTYINITEAPI